MTAERGAGSPRAEHVECSRDGVRLDRLLADAFGCGRRVAREWIRAGLVRVDGRRLAASARVARGSRVSVTARPAGEPAAAGEPVVLAEGEDWIAVAKPSGLHSVAVAGGGASVAGALLARDAALAAVAQRAADAGLVHRLDRDTSGVVLAARTREAWVRLRGRFREQSVRKHYLALVAGSVERTFTVDQPLARRRTRVRLPRRGEPAYPAVSVVVPLIARACWSLVAVSMRTGVTHQIRAHLAMAQHPILGDRTYGEIPAPPAGRDGQLLHAARLIVPGELDVTAPVPGDFAAALRALRRE